MLVLSLQDCLKRLNNSKENIIYLDNLKLIPGAFVKCLDPKDKEAPHKVVRILDIDYKIFLDSKEAEKCGLEKRSGRAKVVLIQEYMYMHEFPLDQRVSRPDNKQFYDSIPVGMEEVVETGNVKWVLEEYIHTTAFVLEPKRIIDNNLQVQGKDDHYIIRYRLFPGETEFVELLPGQFQPFSNPHSRKCMTLDQESIFTTNATLQKQIFQILSRGGGPGEGTCRSATIECGGAGQQYYQYVKAKMGNKLDGTGSKMMELFLDSTRKTKFKLNDLSVSNNRVTHYSNTIRIVDQLQLEAANSVWGCNTLIVPMICASDDAPRPLRLKDTVKLVNCDNNRLVQINKRGKYYSVGTDQLLPTQQRISLKGVDLHCWNSGSYTSKLTVTVRYDKFLAEEEVVRTAVRRCRLSEIPPSLPTFIKVGRYFNYGKENYEVVGIAESESLVQAQSNTNPEKDPVEFPLYELETLIKKQRTRLRRSKRLRCNSSQ